ncbi:MAG: hypothetical protein ABI889_03415 [Gemmatimonadota bacterium]
MSSAIPGQMLSTVAGETISRTRAAPRSATLRVALIAGSAIAATAVVLVAHPSAPVDADLARLLRLMATLKIAMLAGALAVLEWRMRRPLRTSLALGYVALSWIAAGAVTSLWMLASIGASAVVLHVAGAVLVILACADRDFIPAPARTS